MLRQNLKKQGLISPAAEPVENKTTEKIPVSRILNVSCIKFLLETLNMEYLVNGSCAKNGKSKKERKNISTIDIKYVYGKLEKDGDFKKDCVIALARNKETASIYKRKEFKDYSRDGDLRKKNLNEH